MSSDWTIKTNPACQASFTQGPLGCCSSCVACYSWSVCKFSTVKTTFPGNTRGGRFFDGQSCVY